MANTFQPKDSEVSDRSLEVQRLSIPFKITHNAVASAKVLSSDEPSILMLNTLGISQVPASALPPQPPGSVALASAANYGILAATAISTSASSTINGGMAESPGSTVTGAFVVNGPTDIADAAALQAKNDAQAAYTALAANSGYSTIANALDGQSLSAGYYTFAAGDVNLANSGNGTLTLTGSSTDLFVFKVPSTLTTGAGGIPTIVLAGGAVSGNVIWLVGSSATVNVGVTAASAVFRGTIIAVTSITATQVSVVDGRFLALGGAVTMSASAGITLPGGGIPSPFDLAVSDSSGAINFLVSVVASSQLVGDYDEVRKIVSAMVINRGASGVYPCYGNAANSGLDSSLTEMLLNCPTGVNLTTTDLDACLEVEYIVNNLK
jgi:hypothetical protein